VRLSQASDSSVVSTNIRFRVTYTTPADTVARDSCNGGANMVVVGFGHPDDFNG
jgi:hypothetical protein